MKKVSALVGVLLVLAVGALWLLWQRNYEERAIRALLAEAQADAVAGLNRRDPQAMAEYFATVSEGAQAAGLSETEQAYRDLIVALPANSTVQVHSFDLSSLEVHEDAGLARATYRLHFSLVRGSTAVFSAKATQNLALLKTARGWRISGGDALQFEDVSGTWPP